jgi:hypothetical protein
MGAYRLLFFNDCNLCARFDFQADDDHQCAEAAEMLFNACSDRAYLGGYLTVRIRLERTCEDQGTTAGFRFGGA